MPFNHWRSVENRLGSGQSLDLATVQELLDHRDVSTPWFNACIELNRGGRGVRSPADSLGTGLDGNNCRLLSGRLLKVSLQGIVLAIKAIEIGFY